MGQIVEWPKTDNQWALTMIDTEMHSFCLITAGPLPVMRQRMRELSEVLAAAGDPVEVDMSRAVTGYPMITHGKVFLQVITWDEWLEGVNDAFCGHLTATGAHLK